MDPIQNLILGGISSSSANDGVSVSGNKVKLGHVAEGSGLSDFTANRYNYLAGFKWGIGGTAGNNFAQFDGATGQFSLGTATPNEAALCERSSTAKGVLLPRMTTAQKNAISTPPTSLLLFDSTLGVYQYYTGSAWSNIGTTYTGNNGVSLSSSTFQLGHVAAGSGASDFTANRFMYMAGFYLQIGGTANNNLFKFNTNGNYDIAGKLTIGNDATYTTQGTSAIINQTTNGGIAIVPNGTGAFTLRVPDGGNAGGLARGTYAVDFTHASTNSGCATGSYSVIIGGHTNSATATHAIVLGGTSNNATGSNSICGGNQFTVSGSNSYGLGSEGSVSGNNAGGIGRQIVLSGGSSYMMAANSTVTSTYSFLNGTGGKCVTSAQNVFARGLGVNGTSPSSNSGTSQIINGIAGIDTKIAASLAPQASATYMLFNPLNTLGGTEVPFYVPSTSNMMFVVEADIQIRVVGINGTATGVTVGDIKQVKIRQTGKVIGGTLTFLSALTTTLDYEDASLNTMTFVFINSTNRVNIQCTNATFAGGGTLDLLAMATYKVSESSAV